MGKLHFTIQRISHSILHTTLISHVSDFLKNVHCDVNFNCKILASRDYIRIIIDDKD